MILKPFKLKPTKTPEEKKGQENEKQAAYFLDFEFKDSKNYVLMHDVKFNYNGRTAQIDHLAVSRLGIFVIESKFYSGEIKIQKDGNWIVDYGKKKISIPSPIEQNNRHILVLEDILKNEDIYTYGFGIKKMPEIYNMIFISNKTILSGVKPPKNIIKQDSFRKYIDNDMEKIWTPIDNLKKIVKVSSSDKIIEVSKKLLSFTDYKIVEEPEKEIKMKVNKIEEDYSRFRKKTDPGDLEKRLKKLRLDLSKEEKKKPYMIFSNRELEDILDKKPKNIEEFSKISGVGPFKLENYADLFLDEINK